MHKIIYLIDHFEFNYPRDQNYIVKYAFDKGNAVKFVTTKEKWTITKEFERVTVEHQKIIARIPGKYVGIPISHQKLDLSCGFL